MIKIAETMCKSDSNFNAVFENQNEHSRNYIRFRKESCLYYVPPEALIYFISELALGQVSPLNQT